MKAGNPKWPIYLFVLVFKRYQHIYSNSFFIWMIKCFKKEPITYLFGLNKERQTWGTGQDELSEGCKCFQQLLLQWVEHIQSIPKQIKSSGQSEWEKLQWTGRQSHTHTHTNEQSTFEPLHEKLFGNTPLNTWFT